MDAVDVDARGTIILTCVQYVVCFFVEHMLAKTLSRCCLDGFA